MDQQQMDQCPADGEKIAAQRGVARQGFYYVHPLLAGPLRDWPALFDRIAGMGFGSIVLAPPFAAASVLLAEDFDTIHPALAWDGDAASALRFIDAACRDRGLGWLLDVVLDRVAPDGIIARAEPGLFAASPRGRIDPRQGEAAARARFDSEAEALAEWWGQPPASVGPGRCGRLSAAWPVRNPRPGAACYHSPRWRR